MAFPFKAGDRVRVKGYYEEYLIPSKNACAFLYKGYKEKFKTSEPALSTDIVCINLDSGSVSFYPAEKLVMAN